MIKLIKRLLTRPPQVSGQRHMIRRQQNVDPPYVDVEQPLDTFGNVPPGWIPIESVFDTTNIPGTTLCIGNIARIIQTPTGELITLNQKRGVLLGCGHSIFSIDEHITENNVYRGLGGQCLYCSTIAAARLKQGEITLPQAEADSLCCSDCASYCSDCHQTVCTRHALGFLEADGSTLSLCPVCLPKAEHGLMLSRFVAASLTLLFRRRQPPR